MKNLTALFLFTALLMSVNVDAQVTMTATAGVSPQQTPTAHYIFVNRSSPRDEFTFDLSTVKASYFIGVGARYDIKPFFFLAEAQYNKRQYVYSIAYTFPGFGRTEEAVQYTESMNVINLPVSIGVDLGIVDVINGFVPQVILSHQTDLEDIRGYSDKLSTVRFGWHSGIAANVSNMRIGLDWQMDFNNYADHIYVNDQSLALSGRSNRLVGTLSYNF
ncbi:MAG: hypothetical protein KBA14_00465 [Saprospiraceae bacterium]|nr:hypothetical protein [Saprospiraceae bacterium]